MSANQKSSNQLPNSIFAGNLELRLHGKRALEHQPDRLSNDSSIRVLAPYLAIVISSFLLRSHA